MTHQRSPATDAAVARYYNSHRSPVTTRSNHPRVPADPRYSEFQRTPATVRPNPSHPHPHPAATNKFVGAPLLRVAAAPRYYKIQRRDNTATTPRQQLDNMLLKLLFCFVVFVLFRVVVVFFCLTTCYYYF